MDADAMDFPTPESDVDSIAPESLKARIDDGESVTILDARMASDYEEWRVDGETVESINIPYFEFLDEEIDDDVLARIPDDEHVTVLCAKGGASEYVAGALADRGYDVDHLRYLDDADELGVDLKYAFDTHIHADHISGLRELAAEGVEGVIPEAAVDRGVTYADEMTLTNDGDSFAVGGATVETVFTPGHTTGMTSYLVGDSLLATGDGLFIESVARPDLEEGDEGAPEAAAMLHESLQQKVLPLPDETLIGGAHFSDAAEPAADGTYTAPLGDLVDRMDALTMDEDDFIDTVLADMPPRPANYVDIIETNLGQQQADDEEAFTLELGPNNCAASQDALTSDD